MENDARSSASTNAHISTEEFRVYDRQIRLWGIELQQKLKSVRLFVHGVATVTTELCKNCVTAGMSVTIVDDRQVDDNIKRLNFIVAGIPTGAPLATAFAEQLGDMNKFVKCVGVRKAVWREEVQVAENPVFVFCAQPGTTNWSEMKEDMLWCGIEYPKAPIILCYIGSTVGVAALNIDSVPLPGFILNDLNIDKTHELSKPNPVRHKLELLVGQVIKLMDNYPGDAFEDIDGELRLQLVPGHPELLQDRRHLIIISPIIAGLVSHELRKWVAGDAAARRILFFDNEKGEAIFD